MTDLAAAATAAPPRPLSALHASDRASSIGYEPFTCLPSDVDELRERVLLLLAGHRRWQQRCVHALVSRQRARARQQCFFGWMHVAQVRIEADVEIAARLRSRHALRSRGARAFGAWQGAVRRAAWLRRTDARLVLRRGRGMQRACLRAWWHAHLRGPWRDVRRARRLAARAAERRALRLWRAHAALLAGAKELEWRCRRGRALERAARAFGWWRKALPPPGVQRLARRLRNNCILRAFRAWWSAAATTRWQGLVRRRLQGAASLAALAMAPPTLVARHAGAGRDVSERWLEVGSLASRRWVWRISSAAAVPGAVRSFEALARKATLGCAMQRWAAAAQPARAMRWRMAHARRLVLRIGHRGALHAWRRYAAGQARYRRIVKVARKSFARKSARCALRAWLDVHCARRSLDATMARRNGRVRLRQLGGAWSRWRNASARTLWQHRRATVFATRWQARWRKKMLVAWASAAREDAYRRWRGGSLLRRAQQRFLRRVLTAWKAAVRERRVYGLIESRFSGRWLKVRVRLLLRSWHAAAAWAASRAQTVETLHRTRRAKALHVALFTWHRNAVVRHYLDATAQDALDQSNCHILRAGFMVWRHMTRRMVSVTAFINRRQRVLAARVLHCWIAGARLSRAVAVRARLKAIAAYRGLGRRCLAKWRLKTRLAMIAAIGGSRTIRLVNTLWKQRAFSVWYGNAEANRARRGLMHGLAVRYERIRKRMVMRAWAALTDEAMTQQQRVRACIARWTQRGMVECFQAWARHVAAEVGAARLCAAMEVRRRDDLALDVLGGWRALAVDARVLDARAAKAAAKVLRAGLRGALDAWRAFACESKLRRALEEAAAQGERANKLEAALTRSEAHGESVRHELAAKLLEATRRLSKTQGKAHREEAKLREGASACIVELEAANAALADNYRAAELAAVASRQAADASGEALARVQAREGELGNTCEKLRDEVLALRSAVEGANAGRLEAEARATAEHERQQAIERRFEAEARRQRQESAGLLQQHILEDESGRVESADRHALELRRLGSRVTEMAHERSELLVRLSSAEATAALREAEIAGLQRRATQLHAQLLRSEEGERERAAALDALAVQRGEDRAARAVRNARPLLTHDQTPMLVAADAWRLQEPLERPKARCARVGASPLRRPKRRAAVNPKKPPKMSTKAVKASKKKASSAATAAAAPTGGRCAAAAAAARVAAKAASRHALERRPPVALLTPANADVLCRRDENR